MTPISRQPDVEASMRKPSAFMGELNGLPGISVWLNTSEKSALILVSRGYDFIAEVLIYFSCSTADATFAGDLLAHDPTINDWFNGLRDRAIVVAAMEKLTLPFGLVSWKSIAFDRLSEAEYLRLKAEIERIAGATAYHRIASHPAFSRPRLPDE